MTQYYFHDGQQEQGPFGIDQLKSHALKKDTPIWYEGLESWTTVGNVEELKNLVVVTPTPPPLNNINETTTSFTQPPVYSLKPENSFKQTVKKAIKNPLIIVSIIAVVGIMSWLIYQSITQAETIKHNEENVRLQDEELKRQKLDQQAKEQKRITEEQELQKLKDRVNANLAEKYMGYRNNWTNFISVSNNAATYSELGGISNLQVVIENRTDKSIDEVQIIVYYIKTNGGTYKSETVSVTNIGPNSIKSVSAPSSDRGTSVQMKIETITAKSFHFCYPSGMEGDKNIDPYFCK